MLSVCPKCESSSTIPKYCPGDAGKWWDRRCARKGEHLHWQCWECEYRWIGKVASA